MSHIRVMTVYLLLLGLILPENSHGESVSGLFAVSGFGPNAMYQIPLPALNVLFRGNVPTSVNLWELEQGPDAKTAYSYYRQGDSLYLLDLETTSVLSAVTVDTNMFNNGRGFAAAPDGTLYGIFLNSQLRTIDPQTGSTSFVANISGLGTSSVAGPEAMTFGPDGTLYVAASPGNRWGRNLYTMNLSNGLLTQIGPIGSSFIDIDTLAFGPDGFLYGVDTVSGPNDLWRIDPRSGNRSFVLTLPAGINGLHFAVIPLPSAAWMGMILLGGVAVIGALRRRCS